MNCWSCQKEIPDGAVRVRYPQCEAQIEAEPTGNQMAAVSSALAGMGPELIGKLRNAFEKSDNGEDFVS